LSGLTHVYLYLIRIFIFLLSHPNPKYSHPAQNIGGMSRVV
jgi:hypothetical protein